MKIELKIDGKKWWRSPVYLINGDSLHITCSGENVDPIVQAGLEYSEQKLLDATRRLALLNARVSELESLVRRMANARTLEEASGLAYRAGELHEEW